MVEEFSSGGTECFYLKNSLSKAEQRNKLFIWEQELCGSCRTGASQSFQEFLMEFVTISWSSSTPGILVVSNPSALERIATHLGLGFDTIFQYFLVSADLSQGCLRSQSWEANGKSILSLSARK